MVRMVCYFPFSKPKTPFLLASDNFAGVHSEDGRRMHSPPHAPLEINLKLSWHGWRCLHNWTLKISNPVPWMSIYIGLFLFLNSYASTLNIYPSKYYPAYGLQLQTASYLPLHRWAEGPCKGSRVSKAPDLLSSKTASYHSNTKGHR